MVHTLTLGGQIALQGEATKAHNGGEGSNSSK
jgi:hypothetical protein